MRLQYTCSVTRFTLKKRITPFMALLHSIKRAGLSLSNTHKHAHSCTCLATGLCPHKGCRVYEESVSKQKRSITACQLFSVAMDRAETQGPRRESCICPSDSLSPPAALIEDDRIARQQVRIAKKTTMKIERETPVVLVSS